MWKEVDYYMEHDKEEELPLLVDLLDMPVSLQSILNFKLGILCLLQFKQLRDALFFLAKFFSEFGLCVNEMIFQELDIFCLL